MDYDFIKRHRGKFNEKMDKPYLDKKDVLASYDAALVETVLETSEERSKVYDKQMDLLFAALNKEPKGGVQ